MIQAMSGMMSIAGLADMEPWVAPLCVGAVIADLLAGIYASTAILTALEAQHRTGLCQHIDMALLDVGMAMLANQATVYLNTGAVPRRQGNFHPSLAPYQNSSTTDSAMPLAVGNHCQLLRFCQVAGKPE
jgi:crotonobetainyl-CoA:carnitine CoA-transferase CaiB-like acyl-CoA transferase